MSRHGETPPHLARLQAFSRNLQLNYTRVTKKCQLRQPLLNLYLLLNLYMRYRPSKKYLHYPLIGCVCSFLPNNNRFRPYLNYPNAPQRLVKPLPFSEFKNNVEKNS